MIDSITLVIDEKNYFVDRHKLKQLKRSKEAEFWESSSINLGYSKKMKKIGLYGPDFQIARHSRRRGNDLLRATFSIPKMLYGSNYYELSPEDLSVVIKRLEEHMNNAGIIIINFDLRKCIVERIDYSKNVLLPHWAGSAGQLIHLLRDYNNKPRSEFSLNCERTGGEGDYISFYNGSQGFTIYNKISEIIEKGFTDTEKRIVKNVSSGKQKYDILRLEVSLRNKQTLWEFIKRRTDKGSPTFEYLFCQDISKKVLLDVFDQVFTPSTSLLLSLSKMKKDQAEEILRNAGLKLNEVSLALYLSNKFLKIGVKQTYKELEVLYGKKATEHIKNKMKKLPKLVENNEPNDTNIVQFIREKLVNFEPIKPPLA